MFHQGNSCFNKGLAVSYIRVMKKQRHWGEMSPVSILPEIMVLGGGKKRKKLTTEQPFYPSHRTKQTEEEQEEYSCTQLNPSALQWDYKRVCYSNIRLNTT